MADVALIYLPPGEGGSKLGVDDFLASGNSIENLLTLATTEMREPPQEEEDGPPPMPYRETPHGLIYDKPSSRGGTVPTQLTNFKAKIVADIVEDDGAEEKRSSEIEVELNGRRSVFAVPSAQFVGMGWLAEHLGGGAIVYPGFVTKDHTRAAIQMLSGDVPTRRVYAHTGWVNRGDEWVYLHACGATGPKGPVAEVGVSLGDGRLGGYVLPDPPAGENLKRAVEASLRFLDLAPLTIVFPLFAAIYRAPLSEAMPVDFSVYLVGPTGSQKTELTAVVQSHYGAAFNSRFLPANWSSSENALERLAYAAKDAVLTVDDFAPTGTTSDVARLNRVADRLWRSVGNRSGRGRMRADTTLRAEYHPRGLVLGSGEDVPRGQSLRARTSTSEVSRGDVDLDVLTELQRAGAEGLLASLMSAYVKWLAPRMTDLKEGLPTRHTELREHATGAGTHARTPGIVASLALGLETFLEFAVEEGALAEARATELRDEGWEALREAAAAQPGHQAAEEPTQQFRELLTAAIVSGRAHIADAKTGAEPDNAEHWGWRDTLDELRPQGKRIGWLNPDGSLLLEPNAAFAAAQQMARDQGTSLPISEQTLRKRLKEKGLLASRDSRGQRNIVRATIAGERRTVIHLIARALSEHDPDDPNDTPPGTRGGVGPEDGDPSSACEADTARNKGPEAGENESSGPKGPVGPFLDGGSSNGVGQGASPTRPRYSLDGEAELIDTQVGVHDLLPELREADRVALDFETTGLDPREHRVRLLTLATKRGTWLIDCFEVDPRPLFPVLSQKKLLIHNALFDLGMLVEMGFEMGEGGEVVDTMLASQLYEGKGPEEETEEEE